MDAVVTDTPYGVGFEYASHVDSLAAWRALIVPLVQWCRENAQMAVMPSLENCVWREPDYPRAIRMDDGIPRGVDRTNRLKALGNAIVPQIAYEIIKAIVEIDSNLSI